MKANLKRMRSMATSKRHVTRHDRLSKKLEAMEKALRTPDAPRSRNMRRLEKMVRRESQEQL